MAGFSIYAAQKIIDASIRGQAVTFPSNLYLALFTSDPTDANITVNEVAGAWYARQLLGATSAPVGSATSTSNNNQIQFNAVTGSSVTISHWGLYDAASGGNLWYSDSVGTAKTFSVGDVPLLGAGALSLDFQ